MEGVPRLIMLWAPLKSSPEGTSFSNLKKYIAECYQEDPDSYSKEVYALEQLRNSAMHCAKDTKSCGIIKRYYCQLHSLINRFPLASEKNLFTFTWKDLYVSSVSEITDIRYEMAAVLFNIGALHTQIGASVSRIDADGMKLACTHFQCAAWAFDELRQKHRGVNNNSDFMTSELLLFFQQLSYAQAQECILEKSLIDNRKAAIVAKVTAQIISYYNSAMAALLTGGDDGTLSDLVSKARLKEWKKYVTFKILYLHCILFLYQGQQAEEQQKMGERVALYQAAWDKLEEAKKESKGMSEQKEISESLTFTADVVEAKRKAAKNENEYIYHESVPEITDIAAVQGANLVNGIGFSVTDPEVAGDDIFARLIPMKAHEASSLYSEEKAQLLRDVSAKIEGRDNELETFINSLNIEHLNINEERNVKIPQGIVDRCASLNAKSNAIPDLVASMSKLAEICADVETSLREIKNLLNDENTNEKNYQQKSGVQRSNVHVTELSREFQKYLEAHQKAGESNDTLRRAMELHVNNLRILSRPLQEIQSSVPKLSGEINEAIFQDLKNLLNKVNEMKAQRAEFHAELRTAVNNDDVTSKIIAHGNENSLKDLFKKEISKHDKICSLIDQNLSAQDNILTALTDVYAKCAPALKAMVDVKHKKENFFTSLAASYDVYEDLLAKSAKGLEFYKKLQGNVQKLLARVRAARDVQDEERTQRMNSTKVPDKIISDKQISKTGTQPKLRDYLKQSGRGLSNVDTSYVPSIRPNPLGSETPPTTTCIIPPVSYYPQQQQQQQNFQPNEPPPPYTPIAQSHYDSTVGYTNPIYQNSQMYGSGMGALKTTEENYGLTSQFATNAYGGQTYVNQQQQSYSQGYSMPNSAISATHSYSQAQMQQTPESSVNTNTVLQTTANQQLPAQQHYQYPTGVVTSSYSQTHGLDMQATYQQQQLQQLAAEQQSYQNMHQQSSTNQPSSASWTAPDIAKQIENGSLQTGVHAGVVSTSSGIVYNPYQQLQYNPTVSSYNTQINPSETAVQYPPTTSNDALNASFSSYGSHPGYSYNQTTGEYQYASGYQFDPNSSYTQYTNTAANQIASNTTDSVSLSSSDKAYVNQYSTGTNENEKKATETVPTAQLQQYANANASNYYSTPYGYQSVGSTDPNSIPSAYNIASQAYVNGSGSLTYMQSSNYKDTNTTVSGTYGNTAWTNENVSQQNVDQYAANYQSSQQGQSQQQYSHSQQQILQQQQQQQQQQSIHQQQQHVPQQEHHSIPQQPQNPQEKPIAKLAKTGGEMKKSKNPSNVDLLSDIDFSVASEISTPPLKPQIASPTTESVTLSTKESASITGDTYLHEKLPDPLVPNPIEKILQLPSIADVNIDNEKKDLTNPDRKQSCDNLSICSDLSSLDHNFDWDSISVRSEKTQQQIPPSFSDTAKATKFSDPFDDPKVLKYFHKDVETYEKAIETLNVKMLNGNTPLVNKWKELQDLLVKDESKRTTSVAKLFPEKNRSPDCIPYDHARVVLERSTDDYINAAYIKFDKENKLDVGQNCPIFILAQTPLQNTVTDFWSMVWSQKARTIVCLHTPNEILDTFWPQELNKEMNFDDFSVTLVKHFELSHCTELNLKLAMNGADAILDLSLLQIKAWKKNSPNHILEIARNVLVAHKQRSQEFKSKAPLIMNCLTGSERSGIIALAICTILSTKNTRPILINVVDVWYRICSQRKSALKDTNNLQLSMEIVLSHAHDQLNKRGIMTSYQMKNAQTVTEIEKVEIKDPLNDLDPLWKLK